MDDFSIGSDDFDAFDTPVEAPAESALDLASLNPAQRDAVQRLEGPLLVLAGPGSGKTRVITHRIANLLCHGVPAHHILGLTFTNKAADEMKHRVRRLVPGASVWISTFHRFCSRLLREHAAMVGLRENFSILDAADAAKVLKELVSLEEEEEGASNPARLGDVISMAKNNLLTPEDFAEVARPGDERLAARIYPRYQESLQTSNAVDFDDLLMYVAVLLRDNPELRSRLDHQFTHVMVDEYQDTNLAQYAIVRALSQDLPNLCVTGDPDQSIYGWRGASISNILNFEDDYPQAGVVRLEQNYRSTPNVLRAADALIAHNKRRKAKRLIAERDEGQMVRLAIYPSYIDEAANIAERIAMDVESGRRRLSEIAILYRVHSVSRVIERCLMERGVAYRILNGSEFYQRKEVKDVLAYLNLLNNPSNGAAFLRVVNTPPRGIGKKTLERLIQHAHDRRLSLFDAAREAGVVEGLNKRAAVAVARFVTLMDQLQESITDPVELIMDRVLALSAYEDYLDGIDKAEETERTANVRELISAAREYDGCHPEDGTLESFLEQVALVSDTDGLNEDGVAETVTLMTLHSAKGLEYPTVYIIALEEELIPHRRSRESQEDLEEERRLLFVGITRAKEELQLSLAGYRMKRGSNMPTVPSMFLQELPREEMDVQQPSTPRVGRAAGYGETYDGYEHDLYDGDVYQQDSPATDSDLDSQGPSPQREQIGDEVCGGFRIMTAADMLNSEGGLGASEGKSQAAARTDLGSVAGRPAAPEGDPPLDPNRQDRAASRSEGPIAGNFVTDASELAIGLIVTHGEFGAGTVVSLSGRGKKTTVAVRFFGQAKPRKFFLSHARLQVVRSS